MDVYIARIPLKTALLKRVGSFGTLTPVAHVRTLANSHEASMSSSSSSSSLLYVQLYDPNSVNMRPFIGIMDISNGMVTRRSLPRGVDLDSLWYLSRARPLHPPSLHS
jgi:hypothetical protein